MGMLYKCSMTVISATKMRKWSQVRQRSAQMDYKKCEGQKNSVIQCCFAFFLLDFVFFWCFSCVYVHFEGKKQQPCNAYIITNNKFQKLKICIFLLHIPKNPFSPSKRAWKKRKKVLNPAYNIYIYMITKHGIRHVLQHIYMWYRYEPACLIPPVGIYLYLYMYCVYLNESSTISYYTHNSIQPP